MRAAITIGTLLLILFGLTACKTESSSLGNGQVNPAVSNEQVARYSFWDELGDHPLDVELKNCVDENPGSSGVRTCLAESLERWEEELSRIIRLLDESQFLDSASLKQIKTSQLNWGKFKETEFAFIEAQYAGEKGTMYERIITQEKLIVVRHRTLELTGYYQVLAAERE